MKKLAIGAVCAVSTALMSATAFAGYTQPFEVDVDLAGMIASGDMVSARVSTDDDVFIGCGARTVEDGLGGVFEFAFCQAEDAAGERAICNTFNPDLVQAIRAGSDSSFISYSWSDDGSGSLTCTRVGFSNQSFYLGKHVKGNL